MKIFVITDIHGHFKETIDALNDAGYDPICGNHLLISCGDNFDRGSESKEIYEWFKGLQDNGYPVVVLRGNHETMLQDYLSEKSYSPFNYIHNGTNETLDSFLGRTRSFESWCLVDKNIENPTYGDFARYVTYAQKEINSNYPELLSWLENLPYYYETKKYIFTHGAIDTDAEDWHDPKYSIYSLYGWEALAWDDGSFFGKEINNTDKTVVIGHFHTDHLRRLYKVKDNKEADTTLVREDGKIIALDACTVLSKKVNVLVVEDELL